MHYMIPVIIFTLLFNIPCFFEFIFVEKISNITCLGDICCHFENFTTVPNFNENYIRNYDMSELISRRDHNETECIYEQNHDLLPSDLRLDFYYKLVSNILASDVPKSKTKRGKMLSVRDWYFTIRLNFMSQISKLIKPQAILDLALNVDLRILESFCSFSLNLAPK